MNLDSYNAGNAGRFARCIHGHGGDLATESADSTVKLWNVAARQEHLTLRAHQEGVKAVAFHPSGQRIASSGMDGNAIIWDVETGTPLLTLPAQSAKSINAVAFSPDGGILATGSISE